MSLSRFRELARAYGSDLERWPRAERPGARALAERSEEARAELDGERSLDAVFSAFEPPRISDTLAARLARMPGETATRPLAFPRRAWRAPAIGWAAAALFGLWLGTQSAEADVGSDSATAAETIDSASPDVISSEDDGSDSQVVQLASGSIDGWEDLP